MCRTAIRPQVGPCAHCTATVPPYFQVPARKCRTFSDIGVSYQSVLNHWCTNLNWTTHAPICLESVMHQFVLSHWWTNLPWVTDVPICIEPLMHKFALSHWCANLYWATDAQICIEPLMHQSALSHWCTNLLRATDVYNHWSIPVCIGPLIHQFYRFKFFFLNFICLHKFNTARRPQGLACIQNCAQNRIIVRTK